MSSEDPEERAFVERLRAAYTPPPLTAFEAARFDACLRARVAQSTRRRQWTLGGAVLAAAAAALLFVPDLTADPPAEAPAVDWLAAMTGPTDGADWLGDATLPADPLAVPALVVGLPAASDDAAEDPDDEPTAPGWMPAEYEVLAALIDVQPYAPEEDWP